MVLVYACEYIQVVCRQKHFEHYFNIIAVNIVQDAEDAKGGLYNWFARSQQLLTPWRLLLGTLAAVAGAAVLPWPSSALVCGTVVAMTMAAGYYGNAVIGGVVGDFLGATIQVRGRYMVWGVVAALVDTGLVHRLPRWHVTWHWQQTGRDC